MYENYKTGSADDSRHRVMSIFVFLMQGRVFLTFSQPRLIYFFLINEPKWLKDGRFQQSDMKKRVILKLQGSFSRSEPAPPPLQSF